MEYEQTPEEKLVDDLVGLDSSESENLKTVLSISRSRTELKEIVHEALKNGASVNEIQKVYKENLARLNPSYRKVFGIKKENKESRHTIDISTCVIPTLVILVLVIGGIYSIFFMEYEIDSFNKHEVAGISFNIPSEYELNKTGDKGDAFFTNFISEYEVRYDDITDTKYINLLVNVYKNKSVQQVVSEISSEGWDARSETYGKYTVYILGRFGHDGGWFIFEKDGKTVAFHCERNYIIQNIEKIIS